MFSPADITDALEAGLRKHIARDEREQAVYGIDSLDELQIHPVLGKALRAAGYGVHREVRYPSDREKRRDSEGLRCDFVLTPDGKPLAASQRRATLFEPEDAVEPDDAFWLEVKAVAQYTIEGPNRTYSSQLLSTVRQDVTKLSRDEDILHAGLLIVLFVGDQRIADHDLGIWQDRCLQRSLPISAPSLRSLPLNDRLGNRICQLALYPVHHL